MTFHSPFYSYSLFNSLTHLQPSIIGHDQAGISETIEFVLGKYPAAVQRDLAANVFVTGSLASIPGMRERLVCDLHKMRPAGDPIGVTLARDPGGYSIAMQNENTKFQAMHNLFFLQNRVDLLSSSQFFRLCFTVRFFLI